MEIGLIGKVNYDFKCKRCKNTNVGVITRMWRATMAKSNKELIKEVIDDLKRENIIDKAAVLTPYQKTEKLISIYKSLKLSVTRKIIGLEELQKSGTISVNSGISERVSGGNYEYKSEIEKKEDKAEKLRNEIEYFNKIIELIESALKTIEKDKYYKIIELKYFNKKTLEEISEDLNISIITVKRNKNRLINEMSHIFITKNDLQYLTKF